MLQILCKTPAAIFKIQIPANTKSKFNRGDAGINGDGERGSVRAVAPQ